MESVLMDVLISENSDVCEMQIGYVLDLDGKCDYVEILDSNGVRNFTLNNCDRKELMAEIDAYLERQREINK